MQATGKKANTFSGPQPTALLAVGARTLAPGNAGRDAVALL